MDLMAYTPERVEVSAKETSPGVYHLTKNGRVMGDSRGFGPESVRAEIEADVATRRGWRYPDDAVAIIPEGF